MRSSGRASRARIRRCLYRCTGGEPRRLTTRAARRNVLEEIQMRQLFYAMQFKGQAGPGGKEGTMVAKTATDSCRITSTVQEAGLEAAIEPVAGERASFESEVTMTGESSFLESGSIHFGRR